MKIHVYLGYLTEFFLEWEMFEINVVEKNKTNYFTQNVLTNIFSYV